MAWSSFPEWIEILILGPIALACLTLVGSTCVEKLLPGSGARWLLAPSAGLLVFLAIVLPLEALVGLSGPGNGLVLVTVFAAGLLAAPRPRMPPWRFLALLFFIALLAAAPAAILMPQIRDDAVAIGLPIFDHAKVALIDEIARSGLPPRNPFVGASPEPQPLAYYYLWHAGAAVVRTMLGIPGWTAAILLTWGTTYAALSLAAALALRISGRLLAAWCVLPIVAAGSLRAVISDLTGMSTQRILTDWHGLEALAYQAAWVPQHVCAALGVILAAILLRDALHSTPVHRGGAAGAGVFAAVAFGCSAWVGGVLQAIAMAGLAVVTLHAGWRRKHLRPVAEALGIAAVTALALATPFALQQADALDDQRLPIAFRHIRVLAPELTPRHVVTEILGYWLVWLPIEFPAAYVGGMAGLASLACRRMRARPTVESLPLWTCLSVLPLFAVECLRSTLAQNDFAWRGVLVPQIVLAALAAAMVVRAGEGLRAAVLAAFAVVPTAITLPGMLHYVHQQAVAFYVADAATTEQRAFLREPAFWAKVRSHSDSRDRVLNNFRSFAGMTHAPANLGWALFADRRACVAGNEWMLAYGRLTTDDIEATVAELDRLFAGSAHPTSQAALLDRFGCTVVVVRPDDGLWTRDTLAIAPGWKLAFADGTLRLYRREIRQ